LLILSNFFVWWVWELDKPVFHKIGNKKYDNLEKDIVVILYDFGEWVHNLGKILNVSKEFIPVSNSDKNSLNSCK